MTIPDQLFESFDHAVAVAKRLENDNPGMRTWITKTTTVPPTQDPFFVLRAGGNCPFGSFEQGCRKRLVYRGRGGFHLPPV